MFERFADEARRATALASEEARKLGHDFIGTEHLLLGLLAGGEGTAFAVLTELEVTLADVRAKVTERVHAYGTESSASPPFTPLAKKALERALREALQLDAAVIGPEHLLLGLVDVPDGGGARIVVELAGSLDQVRESVLAQIDPRRPSGPPVIHTKAPVTSGARRRWAIPGRTGLSARPDTATPRDTGIEPSGPEPHCPSCQSSLVTEARYRRVDVPPELGGEPAGVAPASPPPDPEPTDSPPPTTDATAATAATSTSVSVSPGTITVTLVYCGHCGVTLGIA